MEHDAHLSPMLPEHIPPGYPREAEQWVDLEDGQRIFVRPIIPEDVERIAHAFEVADIDTIRRRFFTAAPPTDRPHLEYLATVDYVKRFALVATDEDGNSIGIGRYETVEPGMAEVAIVVDRNWRKLGVGTVLLRRLEPLARAHEVAQFEALFLPENTAVAALLRSIGYGDYRVEDGVARLTKFID